MARNHPLMVRLSEEGRKALLETARREDIPAAQLARRALKRELERLATRRKDVSR